MAASKKPLDPKEAALKSVQWAMQSPAHLLTYLGFDVLPQQLQTQEAVLNNQKVAIRGGGSPDGLLHPPTGKPEGRDEIYPCLGT